MSDEAASSCCGWSLLSRSRNVPQQEPVSTPAAHCYISACIPQVLQYAMTMLDFGSLITLQQVSKYMYTLSRERSVWKEYEIPLKLEFGGYDDFSRDILSVLVTLSNSWIMRQFPEAVTFSIAIYGANLAVLKQRFAESWRVTRMAVAHMRDETQVAHLLEFIRRPSVNLVSFIDYGSEAMTGDFLHTLLEIQPNLQSICSHVDFKSLEDNGRLALLKFPKLRTLGATLDAVNHNSLIQQLGPQLHRLILFDASFDAFPFRIVDLANLQYLKLLLKRNDQIPRTWEFIRELPQLHTIHISAVRSFSASHTAEIVLDTIFPPPVFHSPIQLVELETTVDLPFEVTMRFLERTSHLGVRLEFQHSLSVPFSTVISPTPARRTVRKFMNTPHENRVSVKFLKNWKFVFEID